MKIGFLFGSFLRGGSQLQAIGVASGLRHHHEIGFGVLNSSNFDTQLLLEMPRSINLSLNALIDWADVIYYDGSADRRVAAAALAGCAGKVVWFHGSARLGGIRQGIDQNPFPPGVCHIAVSRYVAKKLPVKSSVIYNYDVEAFSSAAPVEKKYDLVIVGRMRPIKNHELFLRIAQAGSFSWLAVGGSSRSYEGHQSAIEKSLRSAARPGIDLVSGLVEHQKVPGLVAQARVGLVTSILEGGAGPIAEIMACGLPVVARKAGGVSEVYGGNQRELLMNKHSSVGAYVRRVRRAMELELTVDQTRQRLEQNFGRNQALKKFDTIFREVALAGG